MNVQPLTTERLPAVPKLDKQHFISSYIQSQKSNAKAYAEEGRAVVISWNPTLNATAKKISSHANVGFSTPVLTARIPKAADPDDPKENPKPPAEKPLPIKSTNKPKEVTKTLDKPIAKKRTIDSDHDEEQAARLLDRRERKRTKRAIVQPKEPSEADTVSSGRPKKKKPKIKEKKPKVPSGFALMHGFSATNVGKNRLTLKPPSNVGVFKKGKASHNTKTKQKSKQRYKNPFSELGFLHNTKKALTVSSTSSTSGDESSVKVVSKAKKTTPAQPQESIPCAASQHPSELSKASTPSKRTPAESIIWDIESRASEKKKSEKEQKPPPDEGTVSHVQGTVVMDARMPAWDDRLSSQPDPVVENPAESKVQDATTIPSSPSLRPSQSASQAGQLLQATGPPEASSRYFKTHEPAKPTKPEAVKPASLLAPDPKTIESHSATELPQFSGALDGPAPTPISFSVPARNRVLAIQFPSAPPFSAQYEDQNPDFPTTIEDYQESERYTFTPDAVESDYYLHEEAPRWDNEPLVNRSGYANFVDLHWDYFADGPWTDGCEGFEVEYEDACGDGLLQDVDSLAYQDWQAESDGYAEDIIMDPTGAVVPEDASVTWEEATANSAVYPDEDGSECQSFAYFSGVEDFGHSEDMMSKSSGSGSAYKARFAQGRALLLGLPVNEAADVGMQSPRPLQHLSHAEQDVAKVLRHHWLPQKL